MIESCLVEEDVREMVRLLGEIVVSDAPLNEKRFSLVSGLCQIIDADAWIWSIASDFRTRGLPVYSMFLMDGIPPSSLGAIVEAAEHPEMKSMQAPFLEVFDRCRGQLTRICPQFVGEERFYSSEAGRIWLKSGFDSNILSARRTLVGDVTTVGLFRRRERTPFTERESRIAHIVLSEVAWIHEQVMPGHSNEGVLSLTPRLRQVLNCLLGGKTRDEIAFELGLSIHTVGGYIKEVYLRFGVRSHPELMRRFFAGDGGDSPGSNL